MSSDRRGDRFEEPLAFTKKEKPRQPARRSTGDSKKTRLRTKTVTEVAREHTDAD